MAIDSSKDKEWNKQMEMIYKEEQEKRMKEVNKRRKEKKNETIQ